MAVAISIDDVINETRMNKFRIGIVGLCMFVMMLDGFDTQAVAFVAPSLMAEWKLTPSALGMIFSSVLFGAIIGAFVFGYVADRIGRRYTLAICVAWFGALNFLNAFAHSFETFLALRFLCGLGLGGAIPNVIAMVSEYAPLRWRATLVSMAWAGFGLGAVSGGLVSIPLIASFGWHSVFVLGGVLPIIVAPVVAIAMPESIKFLSLAAENRAQIAAILRKIDPASRYASDDNFMLDEARHGGGQFLALFRGGLAIGSVFLCFALFMSLLLVYLFINWIPLLLKASGLSMQNAIMGTVIFNLAGVIGSLGCSWFIDRNGRRAIPTLIVVYLAGAVSVASIGFAGGTLGSIMLTIFLSGFFVIGVQLSLNAVIAAYYPTSIRGTGIGWSQVVGRTGSLIGPIVGGSLVAYGLTPGQLFQVSSAAPFLAALSLTIFAILSNRSALAAAGRAQVAERPGADSHVS